MVWVTGSPRGLEFDTQKIIVGKDQARGSRCPSLPTGGKEPWFPSPFPLIEQTHLKAFHPISIGSCCVSWLLTQNWDRNGDRTGTGSQDWDEAGLGAGGLKAGDVTGGTCLPAPLQHGASGGRRDWGGSFVFLAFPP